MEQGWVALPEGDGDWSYALSEGESVENVASTKGARVYGPALVRYVQHSDGAREMYIEDAVPAYEGKGWLQN